MAQVHPASPDDRPPRARNSDTEPPAVRSAAGRFAPAMRFPPRAAIGG